MLMMPSRGLSHSIIPAAPNSVKTLEINCVALSDSTVLIVSTSLVNRLIRSPWACWSK